MAHPQLVAVFHHPNAMDATIYYLDTLVKRGIRRIGIETPNNYDQEGFDELKKIAEESPPETRVKLLRLHHALVAQEPGLTFFAHLAREAKERGIEVIHMQGKNVTVLSHRALAHAIRKTIEKEEVPTNVTVEDVHKIIDRAYRQYSKEYPLGYVMHELRDRKMRIIAHNQKPEVIFAGGSHIVSLALAKKIPLREIVWIEPDIISHRPKSREERNYIARRLKNIRGMLSRQRAVNAIRTANRKKPRH